jgi:hypothetical protein
MAMGNDSATREKNKKKSPQVLVLRAFLAIEIDVIQIGY